MRPSPSAVAECEGGVPGRPPSEGAGPHSGRLRRRRYPREGLRRQRQGIGGSLNWRGLSRVCCLHSRTRLRGGERVFSQVRPWHRGAGLPVVHPDCRDNRLSKAPPGRPSTLARSLSSTRFAVDHRSLRSPSSSLSNTDSAASGGPPRGGSVPGESAGVNQPFRTASASMASARMGLLVSRGGPISATTAPPVRDENGLATSRQPHVLAEPEVQCLDSDESHGDNVAACRSRRAQDG